MWYRIRPQIWGRYPCSAHGRDRGCQERKALGFTKQIMLPNHSDPLIQVGFSCLSTDKKNEDDHLIGVCPGVGKGKATIYSFWLWTLVIAKPPGAGGKWQPDYLEYCALLNLSGSPLPSPKSYWYNLSRSSSFIVFQKSKIMWTPRHLTPGNR